jgi:hypothetical protein
MNPKPHGRRKGLRHFNANHPNFVYHAEKFRAPCEAGIPFDPTDANDIESLRSCNKKRDPTNFVSGNSARDWEKPVHTLRMRTFALDEADHR